MTYTVTRQQNIRNTRSLGHFEIQFFFSHIFLLMSFRKRLQQLLSQSISSVSNLPTVAICFFSGFMLSHTCCNERKFYSMSNQFFQKYIKKNRLDLQSHSIILLYAEETFSLTDNFKVRLVLLVLLLLNIFHSGQTSCFIPGG